MRRIIHSVPFLVYSPSFFVLDAINDGARIERCTLAFNGAAWLLHVKFDYGPAIVRSFGSRDEAIFAMGGRRNVA